MVYYLSSYMYIYSYYRIDIHITLLFFNEKKKKSYKFNLKGMTMQNVSIVKTVKSLSVEVKVDAVIFDKVVGELLGDLPTGINEGRFYSQLKCFSNYPEIYDSVSEIVPGDVSYNAVEVKLILIGGRYDV